MKKLVECIDVPNIMIDVETLSTTSNSIVISLGAVYFNSCGLGNEFYYEVSPDGIEEQQRAGQDININTLFWWMAQGGVAKEVFKQHENKVLTSELLSLFARFIGGNTNINIWGNGADFDNVILINLYRSFRHPLPWNYRNNRCYRTLKTMFPNVEFVREGTHHNALDDAKSQARHLMNILVEL